MSCRSHLYNQTYPHRTHPLRKRIPHNYHNIGLRSSLVITVDTTRPLYIGSLVNLFAGWWVWPRETTPTVRNNWFVSITHSRPISLRSPSSPREVMVFLFHVDLFVYGIQLVLSTEDESINGSHHHQHRAPVVITVFVCFPCHG